MLPGKRSGQLVIFDAVEALGQRDGCLQGEPSRRRPALPGPTPPRRLTVRRPDPHVVYPGFGLEKHMEFDLFVH